MPPIRYLLASFLIPFAFAQAASAEELVAVDPPVPSPARERAAEPAPQRESRGEHEHDGFYLRFHAGFGHTAITEGDFRIAGPSGAFAFSIGGAVAEDLILFGHLTANRMQRPTVSVAGYRLEVNGSVDAVGIGVGLAYYVMPANVYLSGALLATRLEVSNDKGVSLAESKTGGGLELAVGKEWWVSDNWGLGIAGRVMMASIEDARTVSPALVFSATYN